MFTRGDYLRTITGGLAHVERACELQGILKLFDSHVLAQNFFCRILNAVYALKLVEMDKVQANYPAIDLGKFCIQNCVPILPLTRPATRSNTPWTNSWKKALRSSMTGFEF